MVDQATSSASGSWAGRVLRGKYKIVERLGAGGWGAVYAAEHLLLRRSVAIKLLHPDVAADPRFAERFRREAMAASRIGHPSIIEVIDLDRTEDGTEFMVLELLRGESLGKRLERDGALPLDRALYFFEQIASGLAAAHRAGIIHRDLKPDNIFLCRRDDGSETAKILDFGIAKMSGSLGGTQGSITHTGAVLGTPVYMPPEQIRGDKTITTRADMFSLGVMMYESLSGALPFEANNLPQLVMMILEEPPIPLEERRPEIPTRLVEMIHRMLSKEPNDRPENCDLVVDCIREAQLEVAMAASKAAAASGAHALDDFDDDSATMIMSSPISDEQSFNSTTKTLPLETRVEKVEASVPSIVVKDMAAPAPQRPAVKPRLAPPPEPKAPPVMPEVAAPPAPNDRLSLVLGAIAFVVIASLSYWIVSSL